MKTTLAAIVAATVTVLLAQCAYHGQLGYTDPKTGATVGFGVGNTPIPPLELPSRKGLAK